MDSSGSESDSFEVRIDTEYTVPTHNRYTPSKDGWTEVQSRKRARHSTGGGSFEQPFSPGILPHTTQSTQAARDLEYAKQLPMDEKLNVILENMNMLGLLKYRVDNMESTLFLNCAKHEVTDERLKLLEYKQIDIEARNRQVNLIVSGISETKNEDCIKLVCDVIDKNLDMDSETFVIIRAFRLGRTRKPPASHLPPENQKPRNILVTFCQSVEVDVLMDNAYKLKETGIGLSRDYPREISDARKAIWPDFKKARDKYGARNVQIVYPAALMVKKRIVKNMFPDWHQILIGSRHTSITNRVSDTIRKNTEAIREAFSVPTNARSSPPKYQSNSRQTISTNPVSDFETHLDSNRKSHDDNRPSSQNNALHIPIENPNKRGAEGASYKDLTNCEAREMIPEGASRKDKSADTSPVQPVSHSDTRSGHSLASDQNDSANTKGKGPLPAKFSNHVSFRANPLPSEPCKHQQNTQQENPSPVQDRLYSSVVETSSRENSNPKTIRPEVNSNGTHQVNSSQNDLP